MVRFLGSGRSCAVLAILMILAAGCGTGRAHAASAGQPRSPRSPPAPSATGIVKRSGSLTGVTCLPAGTCVAVGWYYYGSTDPTRTLAERWNGSRWRIIPAPSPTHASRFTGVSCPSPAVCLAVGTSANGARTLAERWNGTRWTVQRTPDIGHIGYSALTAVSCATAANCMAVGTYNEGIFGIAEHWDGSRWTIRRLPVPPGPPGEEPLVLPVSVSCTSATVCVTVGGNQTATMAERWNGTTWTIQRTPDPA